MVTIDRGGAGPAGGVAARAFGHDAGHLHGPASGDDKPEVDPDPMLVVEAPDGSQGLAHKDVTEPVEVQRDQ